MADDPEMLRKLAQEAQSEVQKRGVSAQCPLCGQSKWLGMVTSYLMADLDMPQLKFPPPRMPVLNRICGNCGFISMHNLKVLEVIPVEGRK